MSLESLDIEGLGILRALKMMLENKYEFQCAQQFLWPEARRSLEAWK